MKKNIPLFKISTSERDIAAVSNVIRSKASWAVGDSIKDFENYGYSARRFKPTNFNEVSFAGYGRDFKVNLDLRNIEFY